MKTIAFLMLFLTILTNCVGLKPTPTKPTFSSVKKLALLYFGENHAALENNAKTHVIVLKKYKKFEDLLSSVKFFIYDKKSQTIVFEDTLGSGTVKWFSDTEIIAIARNIKKKSGIGRIPKKVYYFDVLTAKKREL